MVSLDEEVSIEKTSIDEMSVEKMSVAEMRYHQRNNRKTHI
jgi:hypothetical protein